LLADPRAGRDTYIVLPPALAAEFPNDNSDLHLGTIWMCERVCGPAEAHLPEPVFAPRAAVVGEAPLPEPVAAPIAANPEPVAEADGDDDADPEEPIEIVDSIELEGPIELVPAPLESSVMTSQADRDDDPRAEDEPTVADVIVAEMLGEEPAALDDRPAPLISTFPPPLADPFEAFLQTLSDVACDAGQTFAASEIGAALADDPVARAWRAILNGESDDFSLCGTPLDEWASGVLARVVSAPHKAAQFRRELRAHGVAAFGLVEAA
jgi:hypothetical protein